MKSKNVYTSENLWKTHLIALLFETSWDSVKSLKQPNEAYNEFLEIFTKLYEDIFR